MEKTREWRKEVFELQRRLFSPLDKIMEGAGTVLSIVLLEYQEMIEKIELELEKRLGEEKIKQIYHSQKGS